MRGFLSLTEWTADKEGWSLTTGLGTENVGGQLHEKKHFSVWERRKVLTKLSGTIVISLPLSFVKEHSILSLHCPFLYEKAFPHRMEKSFWPQCRKTMSGQLHSEHQEHSIPCKKRKFILILYLNSPVKKKAHFFPKQ